MQYPDRRVFRLLLLLLDLIALTAAFQLAVETRIALNAFYGFEMTPAVMAWRVPPIGLILPLWIPVSAWLSLYRPRRGAMVGSLLQLFESVLAVTTITIVVTFFFRDFGTNFSRTFVLYFAGWSLLWMSVVRVMMRASLRLAWRNEHALERVALAGSGAEVKRLAEHLEAIRPPGIALCGVIASGVTTAPSVLGNPVPVLGTIEDAGAIINTHRIDRVIAVASEIDARGLQRLAATCARMGAALHRLPVHVEMESVRLRVHALGDLSLFEVRGVHLTRTQEIAKRVFDVVVGSGILIAAAPLMFFLAAAIKFSSRGPALYVSPRVGKGGRHFSFYKFRSMVAAAAARQDVISATQDGHLYKMKSDPRVTPLGRFMRRYSLDELPQILNVLKGEMSLVGPRPIAARDMQADGMSIEHAFWASQRSQVLPGITGLWQVRGRSDAGFEAMLRYDVEYASTWSLGSDILILLETLPAVFRGRGAY